MSDSGSRASCPNCARTGFLWAFLLLLGAGLLVGEVQGLPERLAHFLVLLGLATGSGLLFVRRLRLRPRDVTAAVAAVAAWAGLMIAAQPALHVLFLLAWAASMAVLLPPDVRGDRWLGGATLAGIVLVLLRIVPGASLLVDQASGWLSQHAGAAWGGARLGASASGLVVFLSFSAFLGATGRRVGRTGALWAVLAGLTAAHMLIQGVLTAPAARTLAKDGFFLVATLLAALAANESSARPPSARRSLCLRTAIAAAVSACILLAIAASPGVWTARDRGPRNVLLYDHDLLASWETPADRPPGAAFSGAMFGLLPEYVAAYGHTCRIVDAIDGDVLREQDLVIIINPGRPFDEKERTSLLRFVHKGGSLLVLADHTDIGGMKGYLDDLLAPIGLVLRFDSAVSVERDWRTALRISYPFSSAYSDLDVPVSIGASVGVRPAAAHVPLLVGTDAYSDPGDRENADRAMLGNLRYDRGEAYGGILLAAATTFGKGKVALFGDTSPFQNGSLAMSYAYIDALVRWLTDRSPAWLEPLRLAFVVLLLAGLMYAFRRPLARPLRCLVLFLLAGVLAGGGAFVATSLSPRLPQVGSLGFIERSRGNLLSVRALADDGIDALSVGLARAGYLPIVVSDRSLTGVARPGDLWVSVGSTESIGVAEGKRIVSRIQDGVDLLLGVPWPTARASATVLQPLGLGVEKTPLGSARPTVSELADGPQFGSAWPLVFSEDWRCLAEVNLKGSAFCTAAERPLGRGQVIAVGDVGIFTNGALESKGHYFAENVAFLALLLEEFGTR